MSSASAPNGRVLAVQQADSALSRLDYDNALRERFGGPEPRFFDAALRHSSFHDRQTDTTQVALVTGSSGGIGLYVAKGLAMLGYTVVILPSRPGLEAETEAARDAIADACLPAATNLIVPEVELDLGSFASTREFCESLLAARTVSRIMRFA